MSDLLQDQDPSAPSPVPLRFLNDFIPQGTEIVAQSRKSTAYVNMGKTPGGCPSRQKEDLSERDGELLKSSSALVLVSRLS